MYTTFTHGIKKMEHPREIFPTFDFLVVEQLYFGPWRDECGTTLTLMWRVSWLQQLGCSGDLIVEHPALINVAAWGNNCPCKP